MFALIESMKKISLLLSRICMLNAVVLMHVLPWLQAMALSVSVIPMVFVPLFLVVVRPKLDMITCLLLKVYVWMLLASLTARMSILVSVYILTPVLYVWWLISISGEAIIITREQLSRRQLVPAALHTPCIFEYVYFARQDSIIDGISVYNARLSMGEALARQVEKIFGDKCDIDVVIPVSTLDIFMWMMKLMDHSFRFLIHPVLLLFKHLTSWIFFIVKALTRIVTLAELSSCLVSKLGKHWMTWKRYYLDWILMGVSSRKNVRRKLNAMTLEFQGKNVLLVDGKVSNITWSFQCVVLMITK